MTLTILPWKTIKRGGSFVVKDTAYERKGVSCTNCKLSYLLIKDTGIRESDHSKRLKLQIICKLDNEDVDTTYANLCHRYTQDMVYKKLI